MGRSPSCDEKTGVKKGPWTPEEDQKLVQFIEKHGHGSWRALPKLAGLNRCGKSCRLRWTNYLRPDIKRGKFTKDEEQTILNLHAILGNKWAAIASHLPGRTDNEIKNFWNTHLKKKLIEMGFDPMTHRPRSDNIFSSLPNLVALTNLKELMNTNQYWPSSVSCDLRLQVEEAVQKAAAIKLQYLQFLLQPPPTSDIINDNETINYLLNSLSSMKDNYQNPIVNTSQLDIDFCHIPNLDDQIPYHDHDDDKSSTTPQAPMLSQVFPSTNQGELNYSSNNINCSLFGSTSSTNNISISTSTISPPVLDHETSSMSNNNIRRGGDASSTTSSFGDQLAPSIWPDLLLDQF